MYILVQGIQK